MWIFIYKYIEERDIDKAKVANVKWRIWVKSLWEFIYTIL